MEDEENFSALSIEARLDHKVKAPPLARAWLIDAECSPLPSLRGEGGNDDSVVVEGQIECL